MGSRIVGMKLDQQPLAEDAPRPNNEGCSRVLSFVRGVTVAVGAVLAMPPDAQSPQVERAARSDGLGKWTKGTDELTEHPIDLKGIFQAMPDCEGLLEPSIPPKPVELQ